MRMFFDECVDQRLRLLFPGHDCHTAGYAKSDALRALDYSITFNVAASGLGGGHRLGIAGGGLTAETLINFE